MDSSITAFSLAICTLSGAYYSKEYNEGNKDLFFNIESEQDMDNNWEKWEFKCDKNVLEKK